MNSADLKKQVSHRLKVWRVLQLGFGPFLSFFCFRQLISRLLEIRAQLIPLNHSSSISIRCWSDIVAYLEIFYTGVYDPVFSKAAIETYCDLGCQSGFALFRLGCLTQPPRQGLLIDGNPYAIQRCKKNLLQSHYQGIYIVHGVVGWDRGKFDDSAPFTICPNELECSLAQGSIPQKGAAEIRVPVIDLEREWLRLMGPRACDLLKIDVEGAEKFILRNDSHFFARVKKCVLEWHGSVTNRMEITALLEKQGFGEFEILWDSPQAGILACRNLVTCHNIQS
jgi:FkbM family methyltransferase